MNAPLNFGIHGAPFWATGLCARRCGRRLVLVLICKLDSSGTDAAVGAVKRKGNAVARVIDNVKTETLERFVRETVSNRVSLICTDDFSGYRRLGHKCRHGVVNHSAGEHVIDDGIVGAIHTNTIEGFWSIIKRVVMGTFHKVSKRNMPLYVAELQFRYNNRENADIFGTAISGC
jgi:transposase-like protein